MKRARLAGRVLFLAAVLCALDLGLERLVLSDDQFLGRPVAPFDPPLFSWPQRQALEFAQRELAANRGGRVRFDAELGWCNKPDSGFGEFRYDWAGARMGPGALAQEKQAGVARVVAVGCSMTHGEEVAASKSWCARVDALRDDLELANLGVAAYGTDQALMRLRRDGWGLDPDEVWLGVLPAAALRITTLYRPLLDHWSMDVAFKPRFALDGEGRLSTIENPAQTLADVVRLLGNQEEFLGALGSEDPWIERARLAYAPRGSCWLQRSFCGRIGLTIWESRGRDLATCFDEQSPFGELYSALVTSMAAECEERGVRFRVLVLPGKDDLAHRAENGRGYWEDWSEGLTRRGVRVTDFSALLEKEPIDSLFMPGGHYTESASELVASDLARSP